MTTIVQALDDLNLDFFQRGQARSPMYDEAVKDIQRALLKDGSYDYLIDGDWGGRTDLSLGKFQAKYGLTPDRKVGPKTAAVLDKVAAGTPTVVAPKPATIPYAADYIAKWNKLVIKPSVLPAIDRVINVMRDDNHWPIYKKIEAATKVPAQITAIIHERESGLKLNTYLGNGQSLSMRTTIVPKNRGPFSPPDAFYKGALDAYGLQKMIGLNWHDGSGIARVSYDVEGFNGFGYRNRGIPSPYLYAGSNLYVRGKYVADGKFDPYYVDTQLGAMTIFKRFVERYPELAL